MRCCSSPPTSPASSPARCCRGTAGPSDAPGTTRMKEHPARRTLLRLASGALLVAPAIARAQSGPWPHRPIKVVVPFAGGGGTDVTMRLLAPKLGEILGQPIVIEN